MAISSRTERWEQFSLILIGAALLIYLLQSALVNVGYEGGWHLYAKKLVDTRFNVSEIYYILPDFYPLLLAVISSVNYGIEAFHLALYASFIALLYLTFRSGGAATLQSIKCAMLIVLIAFLFSPLRVVDYHIFSMLGATASIYGVLSRRYALAYLLIGAVLLTRPHDGIALFCALTLVQLIRGDLWGLIRCVYALLVVAAYYYAIDGMSQSGVLEGVKSATEAKGIQLYDVISRLGIGFIGSIVIAISKPNLLIGNILVIAVIYFEWVKERHLKIVIAVGWLLYVYFFSDSLISLGATPLFVCIYYLWSSVGDEVALHEKNFNKDLLLAAIIPSAYFASSYMSSAGRSSSMGLQSAIAFIVLVIVINRKHIANYQRAVIFSFAITAVVSFILIQKIMSPFSWHLHSSRPLLSGLELYKGKIVERSLGRLYREVCPQLKDQTVLSLPFSNINYVCDINIYKKNINTFFDTTKRAQIDDLLRDLRSDPPPYIYYTRQIQNLVAHEDIFNKGYPLPFREVDAYIVDAILSGRWAATCVARIENGRYIKCEMSDIIKNWVDLNGDHKIRLAEDLNYVLMIRTGNGR